MKYPFFTLITIVSATSIMSLGVFNPTASLLITRDLKRSSMHVGGVQVVSNLFIFLSIAGSPHLFREFSFPFLIFTANGVRAIGFCVYITAVRLAAKKNEALVLIYVSGVIRGIAAFIITAPNVYLGTKVKPDERMRLSAFGTVMTRTFTFIGPMIGSGLASVASTTLDAASAPAYFSLSICFIVFAATFIHQRGFSSNVESEEENLTSTSTSSTSLDAIAEHRYILILLWASVIGGVGGSMVISGTDRKI